MAKTLEEIAKQLKKMKFKSALVGGVDKKDVWKKIERLNDDYMQYIEQQRIGYEAVLAEKDRMIAGGITVNAAQILPGPGAMPPMDPGMMGVAPFGGPAMGPYGDPAMAQFGDPSMAQFGDPSSTASGPPSPQGEGIYGGPQDFPLEGAQGPGDLGFAPTGALRPGDAGLHERRQVAAQPTDEVFYPMPQFDPNMMGLPPMLDENGNPLPMPPMDPNMMGGMPPFDPAMMGLPPMPGADYAPPAGGFEPDWGTPAPADSTVRPLQGELGPQGPEGVYPPPADLAYAHPVDMHPHGDPAMAQFGDPTMPPIPPMTPPGPQMPPFNPGPVPGGMPVSPEGVG